MLTGVVLLYPVLVVMAAFRSRVLGVFGRICHDKKALHLGLNVPMFVWFAAYLYLQWDNSLDALVLVMVLCWSGAIIFSMMLASGIILVSDFVRFRRQKA